MILTEKIHRYILQTTTKVEALAVITANVGLTFLLILICFTGLEKMKSVSTRPRRISGLQIHKIHHRLYVHHQVW